MAIDYEFTPNGNLRITADSRDVTNLRSILSNEEQGWPAAKAHLVASVVGWGLSELRPEQVGALTESLIFGSNVVFGAGDTVVSLDDVFWYPNYEAVDPIDALAANGEVTFTRGLRPEQKASSSFEP